MTCKSLFTKVKNNNEIEKQAKEKKMKIWKTIYELPFKLLIKQGVVQLAQCMYYIFYSNNFIQQSLNSVSAQIQIFFAAYQGGWGPMYSLFKFNS